MEASSYPDEVVEVAADLENFKILNYLRKFLECFAIECEGL